MLKTRVIPCLLLRSTSLVKTIRFKNPRYVGDALNTLRIFNEMEVDEIIVMDISATRENRKPNFDFIGEMAGECFMPLAYGGGIKTPDDAKKIFSLGVEKIAVNTAGHEHPELVTEVARQYGAQAVIVSIDVKKNFLGNYRIATHCGTRNTTVDPVTHARRMQEAGAGEIFLTSVDRDGTFSGYDIDLIKKITSAVSVPVVACGGASSVHDFEKAVKQGGASAVAAGSMVVYQGKDLGVLINFPSPKELKAVLY